MSDGAGVENGQDPEDAMSDGSTDGDESEEFCDEVSDDFAEDDDMNSMGADGRHYVFPPEPFVVVPTISTRTLEYHEHLFEAS
eukprot:scaffold136388_cov34-Attheya_sp.AAC.1